MTATENALMAAALADGLTTIHHAACEPHVQDLCRLLVAMGARDRGHRLEPAARARPAGARRRRRTSSAPITSRSARSSAWPRSRAATSRSPTASPTTCARRCSRSSASACASRSTATTCASRPGRTCAVDDDAHDQIAKIDDGPWPAFPADMTSVAVAVATQARGTVLIFEKMFENRLVFTDKLVNMGARIILCDPHRAVVTGPAKLYGQRLSSPDIRAGIALLIASLCAEGTSVIGDVEQIDRGYERIDERLRALGARIERVSG